MVANMLVRLLIFIMHLAYLSFGLQNLDGGDLHTWINISELITSKIRKDDCNIPMDRSAFFACDRRFMNMKTVESLFYREEVYLCMGVYDVVLHICSLEKNNLNFTSSIQEVSKEMNLETKPEVYGVKNICNRMKTIKFEVGNAELEPWLRELNNTLQNRASCENMCTKSQEVNPLCIFLLWGNTLRAELKVEKVADMNVNISKLIKKADVKPLNSQPSENTLRQPKTVENTDVNLNEPDSNHNKPEEVTNTRQKDPPTLDGPNDDPSPPEDQGNILREESKMYETDTRQSLITLSSNETVQHLEVSADVTKFEDLKSDMSSAALPEPPTTAWKITSFTKNELTDSALPSEYQKHFDNAEDSHFFAYFMTVVVICIIAYLIYHNKHKLLALILEGRRRREMRRRTAHGGYRKLDSSLEEAVTSTCSTSVTHVIY